MRLFRDAFVVVLCVSLAVFFVWAFVDDLRATTTRGDATPVGSVIFKKKTAQRRYADRAVWELMETSTPVYGMDALRTAEGAEAVIRLNDGTEIALEENSLVVLAFDENAQKIEFLGGGITTTGAANSSLVVATADAEFSVAGAAADIRSSASGETTVASLSGSIVMTAKDGIKQTVGPSEEIRIAGSVSSVVRPAATPISPANGAVLVIADADTVPFEWRTDSPAATLELSRTKDFSTADRLVAETAGTAQAKLEAGTWYWRVQPEGGEPSRANRFALSRGESARPLLPATGTRLSFVSDPPSVRFSWTTPPDAIGSDWEVAADEAFTSPVASGSSTSSSVTAGPFDAGTYFWRVRPRYAGRLLGQIAMETRSFTVEREARLAASELISPPEGRVFLAGELEKGAAVLAWKSERNAVSFALELSKDGTFSAPTRLGPFASASYVLPADTATGRYFWRVTAADKTGNAAEPSPSRSFEIASAEQELALESPADGFAFAPGPGRTLTWRGAGTFRLVVESGQGGSAVIDQVIKGRSAELPSLPPGEYRWTVSPEAAETLRSSRVFRVLSPIAAPEPLKPARGVSFSLVNAASLEFTWTQVEGAQSYRFELLDGRGSSVIALDTTGARYVYTEKLEAGAYTWKLIARVAATPSSEEQKSEEGRFAFTISSSREAGPATLLSPGEGEELPGLPARRAGVRLRFRPAETGAKTSLVLASDLAFSRILARMETRGDAFQIERLDSGTYYWKLLSTSKEGIPLPESQPRSFTVNRIPPLDPPKVILPRVGEMVDMSKADALVLRWLAVEGATAYEARLLDANSRRVVWESTRLSRTEARIADLERLDVGAFIFWVRAVAYAAGVQERQGTASEVRFSIGLGPTPQSPSLITPRRIYVP